MKKLLGICICLLLICAAIVPTVVFAADGTTNGSTAEDIIYFLNPTAITTVGNRLFISDIIEDNKSVLHCYDITENVPVKLYTYEVDGYITNLATKENSGLYVVLKDKIMEFTVSDSLEEADNWSVSNAIDVTYGVN